MVCFLKGKLGGWKQKLVEVWSHNNTISYRDEVGLSPFTSKLYYHTLCLIKVLAPMKVVTVSSITDVFDGTNHPMIPMKDIPPSAPPLNYTISICKLDTILKIFLFCSYEFLI